MTVTIFTILIILSEALLRFVVIPNDHFYKQLEIFGALEHTNVVAFGDSHMSQGFFPKHPDMINLGYPGEGFDQIAEKIGFFLETKTTDNIILQIEHHMFADYRFGKYKRDYAHYFGPHATWSSDFALSDPHLHTRLLKFWAFFFKNLGQFPNTSHMHQNGAMTVDLMLNIPPTEADLKYTKRRLKEHTLHENYRDRDTWQLVRDTIQMIKNRDIGLCIISTPVSPYYSDPIDKMPLVREATQRIQNIAIEEGIPYFSYRYIYDDKLEYYRDLDHLNEQGARDLAKRVLNDCDFNE